MRRLVRVFSALKDTHTVAHAAGAATWTRSLDLSLLGTAATFKLYSLTAEGNEKGSNPVTLTRLF